MNCKSYIRSGAALALLASAAIAVASSTSAIAGEKKTIGWSVAYFDHPVYQLMMQAAQKLADQSDCKVIFADGKNDPSVQASQVDNFIAQGVDGILLTPTVSDPLIPAVKKINRAGIPLVMVDRRMQTHGQNLKWEALVSWDMVKSGTIGGEETVKAINGKGNIVVVEGTPGAGSTIDRGNAFYGVIAKYPDIKILAKIPADFDRPKGQDVTENILRRFKPGEIDAIYYMADEMLFGGLQAIKAANRLHEFKVISVDGEKEALDMLRAGDFDYDAEFHPDDQAVAVNILCDIVHGRKPDLANQTFDGRKMDLVEYEGMPWVRPTVYPIDKSNANLPENKGW
jgi:ABC-type sugar transport system substrate-binding protein